MDLKQRVINALSKSEENQGLIIAIKDGKYDHTFRPFYTFKDQDLAESMLVRVLEKKAWAYNL